MKKPLSGQKIALLVANGFDETDFTHAQRRLNASGATLKIISVENGLVNSWVGNGWGHHFPADAHLSTVLAADYDALFVPGGSRSISKLKENAHARRIVRGFFDAGKPMMLLGCASELLTAAERSCDADAHGFLAITAGGDAENPVFEDMDRFFGQEPQIMAQAA